MEKKKLKLSISGSNNKTISSIEQAKNQLSQNKDQGNSPEKIKAQETLNKAKAWFQASKSD